MNGGLRVETCDSICELGHDLIDRCFVNGVAFASARLFLQLRSVIAQSVEPLHAVRVARALSSTLTAGSRALAHASSPANVLWKAFCGRRGAPWLGPV